MLAAISFAACVPLAAFVDVRRLPVQACVAHTGCAARRATVLRLSEPIDIDDTLKAMEKAVSQEDYAEAARLKKLIDAQVAADRARLEMQIMGGGGGAESSSASSTATAAEGPSVTLATALEKGQILVANPERFCSLNPFARPVKDLKRFGIDGPVKMPGLPPDLVALRLPVLILIEHGDGGSRALQLEQRTGALMGDVSMEEFGPCAICPLWFGGTGKTDSLYIVHDVAETESDRTISEGLFLGGWENIKPKVADSSVSEARIKFFVGATEWSPDQLEAEFKAGAWLALDVPPSLVVKDRVSDWRPGEPKPVWREMMDYLPSDDGAVGKLIEQIYGE